MAPGIMLTSSQVGLQNAPFATPLIAEPESKYYSHPIVVLDFQSLYPSVMIAYNICYSTCLGRVEKFKGTDKFGFTELKVADGLLELLNDYLTVTPNGMVYVKPAVRKSLLAKMLGEILDTRVMVKHAMKGGRGDKALLQLLNARQLGLKLMAVSAGCISDADVLECHLWLHECHLLGPNALHRSRRLDCADW